MTIEDVKYSIKNHIVNSISHRDLCALCNIFTIPIENRRKQNQKNLLDSILGATDLTLLHHILYMLNKSSAGSGADPLVSPQMRSAVQSFAQNVQQRQVPCADPASALYCLSGELLDHGPIDLRRELVPGVNPQNIFVPNFTKYPSGHFTAPLAGPSLMHGRLALPSAQLPYTSKNCTVRPSPFYCCQVVLHPLSLLIPKPTPNIAQPSRVMSKMLLSFTVSSSVRQLLTAHRSQLNNRRQYKWQLLLRFAAYDPSRPFPPPGDIVAHLPDCIPPYLNLSVNNVSVPLWDILPSNSTAKEGKRHSRPINISEHIKYNVVDEQGYRQMVCVNWWQTPGVYQYYYAAVYLERKLEVGELLAQFTKRQHAVQRPISFTLDFIRDKFSTNNSQASKKIGDNEEEEEDDLIISSVLPVSLLCPLGKSRISCPLRSINCQHLQCFDAHLYLMMNERRSVWKCPVCDGQATLSDLFVDEYFQGILSDFQDDEAVSEVNVNPDGSYVPVAVKESREGRKHVGNISSRVDEPSANSDTGKSTVNDNSTESQPLILLESDDDDDTNNNGGVGDCGVVIEIPKNLNVIRAQPQTNDTDSVKVTESISSSTQLTPPKGADFTIDLTSDSDEDVCMLESNDDISPMIRSMPIPQPLNPCPNILNSLHNRINIPKLLPKISHNMNDTLNNYPSFFINDNMSNHFSRIPPNTRLLLPNSKTSVPIVSNMPLFQNNQSYPLFTKDPINACVSHSSIMASCSKPSNVNQMNLLDTPIKVDPYNINNGQFSNESTPPSTTTSSSKRSQLQHQPPSKSYAASMQVLMESRGSRRSSRIQHQNKKKYIESSSSSCSDNDSNEESDSSNIGCNDGDRLRRKRENPFDDDDTGSSGSDFTKIKRKKSRR